MHIISSWPSVCVWVISHLVPAVVSFKLHVIIRETPLVQLPTVVRSFMLLVLVLMVMVVIVIVLVVMIRPNVQTCHETLQICRESHKIKNIYHLLMRQKTTSALLPTRRTLTSDSEVLRAQAAQDVVYKEALRWQ